MDVLFGFYIQRKYDNGVKCSRVFYFYVFFIARWREERKKTDKLLMFDILRRNLVDCKIKWSTKTKVVCVEFTNICSINQTEIFITGLLFGLQKYEEEKDRQMRLWKAQEIFFVLKLFLLGKKFLRVEDVAVLKTTKDWRAWMK